MEDRKIDLVSVEGVVEDIIYQSRETGYTVCVIDLDNEPVTLVGTMPALSLGEAVRAMGQWTTHPTYGKQFKVAYFEKAMPLDESAMLRYLASRAIRGVGPKLAARIVSLFHEESFDIIENHPEMLSEVRGITLKKAMEISESFKEQFGVRNIMMFFSGFFGEATSVRIYKRWGNAAVDIVRQNPYLLCDEIYGIGFERADAMAQTLGLENDSFPRIRAGLRYVLKYNAAANGHTFLPLEKLVEAGANLLELPAEQVRETALSLCRECDLMCHEEAERAVYLPEYFHAEADSASKLTLLSNINLFGSIEGTEELIRETEREQGITYAPAQLAAIRCVITKSVTVLTGGPGTGKTTIIKAIVNIFRRVGMEIALAAPTGRAAKRMSQSTGEEAKTVHRLLEMEYSPEETVRFVKNEKNLLPYDVILIDELSMVDILLFSALLKAVKPGARLVLIGDSDQLPSVGAGQVLADTIESGCFPVCRLDQIFRQSGGSAIIQNAHRINRGEYPVSSGKDGDFFLMQRFTPASVAQTIVELCTSRLPRTYGAQVAQEIQVISCTRRGEIGTVNLNLLLQSALNPPAPGKNEKAFREIIFREEDKVMQIRNNYDLEWTLREDENQCGFGVFNGDIGKILAVDSENERITVDYDGKLVRYSFDELDEIEHAFAVTVHKSQGSEYPIVIFPVLNPPSMLATRNLLYTGVTRAQKMAILVGDQATVCRMVDHKETSRRYTGLLDMYRVFQQKSNP